MPGPGRKPKKKGRARKGTGAIWEYKPGRFRGLLDLGIGPDGKRKRVSVTGASVEEVQEKLDAMKLDMLQGVRVKPEKMTVRDHFREFLREKARKIQLNTLHKYENHVENHILPALGHLKLSELDYRHINAFFELLEAKTRKDGRPALSRTTQTDIARVLSMGVNDAVRKGLIRENPVHKVEGPEYEEEEARYMTPEEQAAFLEAIKGERLEELYILGLHTGLRPSELLGLPWESVDLEQGKLRVAQALHESGSAIWIGRLKSEHSYRTISLGREAIAALKRQRVRQLQEKLKAGPKWSPPPVEKPYSGNLVFTTETGGWLRRSTIYKYDLARVRERSGLHDVGLHTLRHTHAAILIHMGASALQVKERLGHKDVSFTLQKYGHLFPKDDERAAALMDSFAAALAQRR